MWFEFLIALLVFLGIMAVASVVFGAWLIVMAARFVWRRVFGMPSPHARRPIALLQTSARNQCVRPLCCAENPPTARFCRRCGRVLPAAQQVAVRRVAMW